MGERTRGRPPETSHDKIRDIALGLFLDQGYRNTSLTSIAKEAGISRTTLFSYFSSKPQIIWEDQELQHQAIERGMSEHPTYPLVDLIVRGLQVNYHIRIEDHAVLAARATIVRQDDETMAYAALIQQRASTEIARLAELRAPEADAKLTLMVSKALAAASTHIIFEWADAPEPSMDLDDHLARQLKPLIDVLRPLLP